MINIQEIIRPNLNRFADVARKEVGGRAVSKYMRDAGATTPEAQRSLGKNPRTGAGSLRIVTSRLVKSITGAREARVDMNVEGGIDVRLKDGRIEIIYFTNVPYARAHEKGFRGMVSISAHQRTITQAFGKPIQKKQVSVRAHSKRLAIPARPYLAPAAEDSRGILQRKFSDIIAEEIRRKYGK